MTHVKKRIKYALIKKFNKVTHVKKRIKYVLIKRSNMMIHVKRRLKLFFYYNRDFCIMGCFRFFIKVLISLL